MSLVENYINDVIEGIKKKKGNVLDLTRDNIILTADTCEINPESLANDIEKRIIRENLAAEAPVLMRRLKQIQGTEPLPKERYERSEKMKVVRKRWRIKRKTEAIREDGRIRGLIEERNQKHIMTGTAFSTYMSLYEIARKEGMTRTEADRTALSVFNKNPAVRDKYLARKKKQLARKMNILHPNAPLFTEKKKRIKKLF